MSWIGNHGLVEPPFSHVELQTAINEASTKSGDVLLEIPNCDVTHTAATFTDMQGGFGGANSFQIRGLNNSILDSNGRPTGCGTNLGAASFGFVGRDGFPFRVSNMRIHGASVGIAGFGIHISGTSKSWRFDHIFFDNFSASNRCVFVTDKGTEVTYGLLDHLNVQEYGKNFLHYQPDANFGGGNYSWIRPLGLGGVDTLCIENSTFYKTTYNPSVAVVDANGPGRFMIRHSDLTNSWIQAHDAIVNGFRGVRKWELYDLNINLTDLGNNFIALQPRGGTGVIYNIAITGNGSIILQCYRADQLGGDPPWANLAGSGAKANLQTTNAPLINGTGAGFFDIDGAGTGGYPARDQAGTDENTPQVSRPFLIWNITRNGVPVLEDGIGRGTTPSAELIFPGRDFCVAESTMPTTCNGVTTDYVPLTYPHPLTGEEPPPSFTPAQIFLQ